MTAPDTETVKVQRAEHKAPKEATLRFLTENRDFFRARLDDLLLTLQSERGADGQPLDPRFLKYQEMLAAIRAAQDSAAASDAWIRQRELMESVGDLAELEGEMDEMERLLVDQEQRLAWLEQDFVGRQNTALVVLLKGVPAGPAPSGIVLADADGETVRVSMDEASRAALERGGDVGLVRRLAEPREHRWELSFEGAGWDGRSWDVILDPARDRLTFLEIDASGLDPARPEAQPVARHWTR
jgi:hypothetical protein